MLFYYQEFEGTPKASFPAQSDYESDGEEAFPELEIPVSTEHFFFKSWANWASMVSKKSWQDIKGVDGLNSLRTSYNTNDVDFINSVSIFMKPKSMRIYAFWCLVNKVADDSVLSNVWNFAIYIRFFSPMFTNFVKYVSRFSAITLIALST